MKFDTKALVRMHPDFQTDIAIEPIAFTAKVKAGFSLASGPVQGRVGEVPLRLHIPFLKRRQATTVATLGGFSFGLDPVKLSLEGGRAELGGTLGAEGIKAAATGKVRCQTELDIDGSASLNLPALLRCLVEQNGAKKETTE